MHKSSTRRLSVGEIRRAIDALAPAARDKLLKTVGRNGRNGQGKRLTPPSRNGYNPGMPIATKPPKSVPNGLGRKIAEAREAAGLTQEQLSARADVSREHLADLEKDHHRPQRRTLKAIATALGLTTDDLLASV